MTVIDEGSPDKYNKRRWNCQCECGTKKLINAISLIRGVSSSCGCYSRELNRIGGYKDISKSCWRRMVQAAVSKGMECDITPEYVWNIYEAQNRKCCYTGLDITFHGNSNKPEKQTASIDRIDSFKGYVHGNIQIVHKTVNMVKSWLPNDEFIAICILVATHFRKNNETDIEFIERKVLGKINEDGRWHTSKKRYVDKKENVSGNTN